MLRNSSILDSDKPRLLSGWDRSPMQTENSQTEGKRIIPETRFTEFLALSVDPRVGISWSASETDVWLFSYL